jgi:branched-chain amino acid transport system permease protein
VASTLVRSSSEPVGDEPFADLDNDDQGRSPGGLVLRAGILLILLGAVFVSPLLMPTASVNVISRIACFAIVALSLNILIGYTGQVSLGHSAFLGVGAFTAGFAITELELPWLAAQVLAIGVGGLAALILGIVALRVKGMYLALVTLAYGLFAERVLFNIGAVTRGGAGMPADRPEVIGLNDVAYAYVCIAALVLVWLIDWRLTASKAGRAIQAIRDSERVAASWGINVTGYKLLAFVMSGALAGLAGGLFASIEQIVSNLTFTFTLSLTFLLMTVVGGIGSRVGVVLGAIIFSSMAFTLDTIARLIPGFPLDGSAEALVGALLLVIVLLRFPGGLAQLLAPLQRWMALRPDAAPRTSASGRGETADVRP